MNATPKDDRGNLFPMPVKQRDALRFVAQFHRHNRPPSGGVFCTGIARDGVLVGVLIAGRPTRPQDDDGYTLEVTRSCVKEGVPNGASKLLGQARKAAAGLGYRKLITRTRGDEPGSSLVAAGWEATSVVDGLHSWSRPGRRRSEAHLGMPKIRWEVLV
jgi:hypothetical protein